MAEIVPIRHFNQVDLSRRWSLSPRTLERWRWLGQGPRFLKVGGRVLYRLEDIEAYEAEQLARAIASFPSSRESGAGGVSAARGVRK